MKKLMCAILSAGMAMTMLSSACVRADEKEVTVELDGEIIEFDTVPEIIDGHTMVPLRKIFEEIGALVKWNDETQTVTARKSSKTVSVQIGSKELTIDKGKTDENGNAVSETVSLEVPPQLSSERTLVPLRAISESFGLEVEWDENEKRVIITSNKDEDSSWKENTGEINLTDLTATGDGVSNDGTNILISAGGDFTVTGELADGCITVSTEEKVKLRLSGASITTAKGPCIYIESADKAYITVTADTENTLTAENGEDGAIYSKDNLEIKGGGTLTVVSKAGHAIKSTGNLTVENGNIDIEAFGDGIHVNNTFKMTGGSVNISAVGDGVDSESIVIIEDGTLNIETNGEPTTTSQKNQNADATSDKMPDFPGFESTADVEFEKSTKGINAEWMLCIGGGEITVNSASHAIHCQDEAQLSGGVLTLASKYDKGISAHGNLTVSGDDTVINITKSTEGMESKNILTINDGKIKIVSSDDAINATGGRSGREMPGGNRFDNGTGGKETMPNFGGRNDAAPQNGEKRENGERRENGEKRENGGITPPDNANMNEKPERPQDGRFGGGMRPFDSENGEMPQPPDMQNGGEMRPQGAQNATAPNGNRADMPDCLVINGGDITLCAGDDCLDSNGNLIINGGIIRATNSTGEFAGAFAVLDPDGQTTVSENATLIFATASGGRGLNMTQNSIAVYCENTHSANDKITLCDDKDNVICEYTPGGEYKTVLIASDKIKTGEKYTLTVGEEKFELEISQKETTVGTENNGNGAFTQNRGNRAR